MITGKPVKVSFSNDADLWFKGYLTAGDIHYTHFAYDMTPVRCLINCVVQAQFNAEDQVSWDNSSPASTRSYTPSSSGSGGGDDPAAPPAWSDVLGSW